MTGNKRAHFFCTKNDVIGCDIRLSAENHLCENVIWAEFSLVNAIIQCLFKLMEKKEKKKEQLHFHNERVGGIFGNIYSMKEMSLACETV